MVVGCLRDSHGRWGVGGRVRDGVQRAAVHELVMCCSAYASPENTENSDVRTLPHLPVCSERVD
jgi:hypothetical protein